MATTINCPRCHAALDVPPDKVGRTTTCPRCQTNVFLKAPAGSEDLGAFQLLDAPKPPAPVLPEAIPLAGPQVPPPATGGAQEAMDDLAWYAPPPPDELKPRKRKKKKQPVASGGMDRDRVRWIIGSIVALVFVGVPVVAFGWLLVVLFRPMAGGTVDPVDAVAADKWQPLEIPNRIKVRLPGTSQRQTRTVAGVEFIWYSADPDQDQSYGFGYTENPLPPKLRALSTDALLDDSCNGCLAMTKGAQELSREAIRLGPHAGKQLVMSLPQGNLKGILRTYYNAGSGRRYLVMAAGRGLDPDHANVRRLFESFEILDSEITAPEEPPQPPPAVPPEVVRKDNDPPVGRRGRLPIPQRPPEPEKPKPPGLLAEIALPADAGGVMAVAYSRDGKTLTVATRSERAFWYEADSRKPIASQPPRKASTGGGDLTSCDISPAGDRVAFVKHGGLLYFLERGNPPDEVILQPTRSGNIHQWKVAFAPDGKFLCTTHGDGMARIWDVEARRMAHELKGFGQQVGSTAYAPDGSLLACADTNVWLWDPATWQSINKFKGPGQAIFSALAFAPDGRLLAGIHDRTVHLWAVERDAAKSKPSAPSRELHHFGRVQQVVFSPDGRLLLSATDDGKLRLSDPQSLKRRAEFAPDLIPPAAALAFRQADGQLALGSGNRVLLFDLSAWKLE
jgi:WD40 repeat protein